MNTIVCIGIPAGRILPRACRVCGCTDEAACPEGCYWVEEDLCSACAPLDHPGIFRDIDDCLDDDEDWDDDDEDWDDDDEWDSEEWEEDEDDARGEIKAGWKDEANNQETM